MNGVFFILNTLRMIILIIIMIIVIGNTADPPFYKPISYFCQKSKMTTNEAPSCPKSIRTKQLFPKHREASVGAILDAQNE